MIRDTSLILQMQLAILGVVLVGGFFYLWRSISRLEQKLEMWMGKVQMNNTSTAPNQVLSSSTSPIVDDATAEEFMKQVFGGAPTAEADNFLMFMTNKPVNGSENMDPPMSKSVVVEEIVNQQDEHVDADDHVSEAETDTNNPLSRSKLRRMNAETLKELCKERGLSTEGSKAVLIERLLGLARE